MKQKEEDSECHAEDGDGEPGVGDVRQPDTHSSSFVRFFRKQKRGEDWHTKKATWST